MLYRLKKRLIAIFMGVPFRYKNVWYNQSIHTNELYPEVVDEKGKYIPCKKGKRVVMGHDAKDNPIFYRIKRAWVMDGSDPEHPSDAWMCDIEFESIEKGPKQPLGFLGGRTDEGSETSSNDNMGIAYQLKIEKQ